MRNASPDHNRTASISIPINNTCRRTFPTTSVKALLTIWVKKSEMGLVRKKTHLHCLIGNLLGACAVSHTIQHTWCALVKGRVTYGRLAPIPVSHSQFLTVLGWTGWQWVSTVVRAVWWQLDNDCANGRDEIHYLYVKTNVTRGCPDCNHSASCLPLTSHKTFNSGHVHPKMISNFVAVSDPASE